jgi:hypothetical protein
MYNKLFTKILDSSIWLAPDPHRLVWITFLAAMDEDGNAMFASAANVAARARVTREQAEAAIASFEAPDPDSGDPDNEGRRIERFPGGWHVLNAAKYRALVTKAIIREQTRVRVARHREKANAGVTHGKREANAPVTPSEAIAIAIAIAEESATALSAREASAYGRIAGIIRAAGIMDAAPGHMKFRSLVDAGATAEEFLAHIPRCLEGGKRFAYLLGAVEGERKRAVSVALHKGPMPKSAKEAATEAKRARIAEMTGGLMGGKSEVIDV